ncbi:MAG: KWG repeat-containing protein [Bacteroidetes bacterium]|nr:MAG: KWG repeat-containing protein [Bacteroidota bacterium]
MRTPILLFLLCFALQGYAQGVLDPGKAPSRPKPKPVVLHIVQEKGDCAFGLKNDEGFWVVSPKYHSIEAVNAYMYKKLWIVSREGLLFGLLDSTGREIFEPKFFGIKYFSGTGNEFFIYHDASQRSGVIDVAGNVILPAEYNEISRYNYKHRLFFAERNDSITVVAADGKVIIPIREGEISAFKYGKAIIDTTIYLPQENTKKKKKVPRKYFYLYGCADTSGKRIIPVIYSGILCISKHILPVKRDSLWGLVNWKNEVIFPFEAERMDVFGKDSLIRVTLHGRQGLLNQWGGWLIPPEYDSIAYMTPREIIPLFKNGKWIFADSAGRIMDRPPLDAVQYFSQKERYLSRIRAIALLENKYGVLDDSINWVFQPSADYMGWYCNTGSYLHRDTLWAYHAGPNAKVRVYVLRSEYKVRYVWNHRTHENERKGYYEYRYDTIPFSAIARKPVTIFRGDGFNLAAGPDGRLLLPPQPYELKKTPGADFIIEGPKGKGIMDVSGKLIIPPVMKKAGRLREFSTLAEQFTPYLDTDPFYYVETFSEKLGVFDSSGKMVADTVYSRIYQTRMAPDPGFWIAYHEADKQWEIIRDDGRIKRSEALPRINGEYIVTGNDKMRRSIYRGDSREPLLTMQRMYIMPCGKNRFEIYKRWRKEGLMDYTGKVLLPLAYWDITNIGENLWRVTGKGGAGLCDSNGVWFSKPEPLDFYKRNIRLDSIFTGIPYYESRRHPAHVGDTTAPAMDGTVRRSHRLGYYELLDDKTVHLKKQMINNFLAEKRLKEIHYAYPAETKIEVAIKGYNYRSSETNHFKDYQLAALTGSSFTVRNSDTYFVSGYLGEQKETYDNYYIDGNEIRRFNVNEIFLDEKINDVVNLLLEQLKLKTPDVFVYDCGRPGSIACDDFIVRENGIDFLYVNKSKNISYSAQRHEKINTFVVHLRYDKIKSLIDPTGPLKDIYTK